MQRVKKNIKEGKEIGHFQPWFMIYAACKSTNLRVHQQVVQKNVRLDESSVPKHLTAIWSRPGLCITRPNGVGGWTVCHSVCHCLAVRPKEGSAYRLYLGVIVHIRSYMR